PEVDPVDQSREAVVVQRERREELASSRERDESDPVLGPPMDELLRDGLGDIETVLRPKILAAHAPREIDREDDVDSFAHDLAHLASRLGTRGRGRKEKRRDGKEPRRDPRKENARALRLGKREEPWHRKVRSFPAVPAREKKPDECARNEEKEIPGLGEAHDQAPPLFEGPADGGASGGAETPADPGATVGAGGGRRSGTAAASSSISFASARRSSCRANFARSLLRRILPRPAIASGWSPPRARSSRSSSVVVRSSAGTSVTAAAYFRIASERAS